MPNSSLKLCFVADATNIHVQRWLRYFLDQGHQVYCLTDRHDKGRLEHLAGASIIDIPNRETLAQEAKKTDKMSVLKARGKAIRRLLKEIKPDILHAIFLHQRGWSAAYAGFQPLVISLLGSDMLLPRKHYRSKAELRRDEKLNALTLRQASLITGVSDDLCKIAARLTRMRSLVEMLPIGIDPELFVPDLDTSDLRERLNIPENAFVILSPRQITSLYNQETIIQSLPKVLSEIPNAILILKDTSCNTDERKAYVKKLKALSQSLKVDYAIRWEAEVGMEELPYFYNLADLVISIPSTDGMPVTIFEAMACRKPVIVGDLPAYDHVILNGQTGLRVPLRNHQALALAIIKLRGNQELRERILEESQLILQEYGIFDQQMQRMERYYFALKNGRMNRPKSAWSWMDALKFNVIAHFA
ncbi:MAG: glycosyltransferase family 4 protein [Vampirovibrionales bacterium]|nr:glycosyltransferase family 4 protein [Vampirovibrionales bacterium]